MVIFSMWNSLVVFSQRMVTTEGIRSSRGRAGQGSRVMGRGGELSGRRRGGGARSPLEAVCTFFLCFSFVGRRVEEEENPTMTAQAGRDQEKGLNV